MYPLFIKFQREYPAACCGDESQVGVASSSPFPAMPPSLLGGCLLYINSAKGTSYLGVLTSRYGGGIFVVFVQVGFDRCYP